MDLFNGINVFFDFNISDFYEISFGGGYKNWFSFFCVEVFVKFVGNLKV